MRIRVRLLLPAPGAFAALGISLLLHMVVVTLALIGSTRRGVGAPPPAALRGTLSAGRPRVALGLRGG